MAFYANWVMALPKRLEQKFNDFVTQYEEDRQMPYMTSIERFGIEKGRKEGQKEGCQLSIIETLKIRFKQVPLSVAKKILAVEDTKLLSKLFREALLSESLKTFKQKFEQSA